MNTWQKVLLLVAVLGAVASADVQKVCGLHTSALMGEMGKACVEPHFGGGKLDAVLESYSLEAFQTLFRNFCPHVGELTSCSAGVRNQFASNCEATNFTRSYTIISELMEHLLTSGCENEGERLAYSIHLLHVMKVRRDLPIPIRRCLLRSNTIIDYAAKNFYNNPSYSYQFYREFSNLKTCVPYIEDETYKSALQWLLDEVAASMKCQHPEEKTMVLCSAIDASTAPPITICEDLKGDNLYDVLEEKISKTCYSRAFDHDQEEEYNSQIKDLEFLKDQYREICIDYREAPECFLEVSAIGESCLSQEEDKHFQLEVQGVEDYMSRLCVEDGVFLATVMHEVYKNIPERGHAFRDCYQTAEEPATNHTSHEASSRSMRFYHDTVEYNKCVVEKFHGTSELSSNLQTALNDILKKMKCVNPEDGSVVLCETIHQH